MNINIDNIIDMRTASSDPAALNAIKELSDSDFIKSCCDVALEAEKLIHEDYIKPHYIITLHEKPAGAGYESIIKVTVFIEGVVNTMAETEYIKSFLASLVESLNN